MIRFSARNGGDAAAKFSGDINDETGEEFVEALEFIHHLIARGYTVKMWKVQP